MYMHESFYTTISLQTGRFQHCHYFDSVNLSFTISRCVIWLVLNTSIRHKINRPFFTRKLITMVSRTLNIPPHWRTIKKDSRIYDCVYILSFIIPTCNAVSCRFSISASIMPTCTGFFNLCLQH